MFGLGLFTCIFGLKMGLEMTKPLVVVLSIVVGGVVGELLKIEDILEQIGTKLKNIIRIQNKTSFTEGFVFASLLFCAGPMTILGCLQAGLENKPELLFLKGLMDGVASFILAASLGLGVMFSALTVLLFQGTLTLLAQHLTFLDTNGYLNDLTGVGGIIIFAIGLKLLGIKKIKVANFLPALLFVILFLFLSNLF